MSKKTQAELAEAAPIVPPEDPLDFDPELLNDMADPPISPVELAEFREEFENAAGSEIERWDKHFDEQLEAADLARLGYLLDHYTQLHGIAKTMSTHLNKLASKLKYNVLPAAMEAAQQEDAKITGLGKLRVSDDISTKVLDSDALEDLLDSAGQSEMVKPTINASSLKAWIRREMEKGEEGVEIPADVVRVTPVTQVILTKS